MIKMFLNLKATLQNLLDSYERTTSNKGFLFWGFFFYLPMSLGERIEFLDFKWDLYIKGLQTVIYLDISWLFGQVPHEIP